MIDCPLTLKAQKKVDCWVSIPTCHILMLWVGGQPEVPNQTVNIWWVKKQKKQSITICQMRKPKGRRNWIFKEFVRRSQRKSWSLVWVYGTQTSFSSSLNKDMFRFKTVKSKTENQMSSSLLLYPQPGSFSRLRVYIWFTNLNISQIHVVCFICLHWK